VVQETGADKLQQGLQVELRPRAVTLRCDSLSSEHGGHASAGMSLAHELLSGVPRGLRHTTPQKNLCVLFQRAGGEENGILDEENTGEAG